MAATYLPVYQLSEAASPTENDYLVFQSSASNGDVGLLPISTFMTTFIQSIIDDITIDSTVLDKYTAMGWVDQTT